MNTKQWLDEVAKSALCSRVTLQATYDAACSVIRNGVPGDFVECGVWAGANSAAMARAILDQIDCLERLRMPRPHGGLWPRVHLFDSFEGVPAAGPHDTDWTHEPGTSACSIKTTRQQMKAWGIPEELLVYHPGWFSETVNKVQGPIALLRLDGDLYESTKVCLEHLYPLVSPGGIVIVDDWVLAGHVQHHGAVAQAQEKRADLAEAQVRAMFGTLEAERATLLARVQQIDVWDSCRGYCHHVAGGNQFGFCKT